MDLTQFKKDVYSQFGQDGIIEKIFSIIPMPKDRLPVAVEFGAWDGVFASNTCRLLRECNWRCVYIEPDPVRFKKLNENHGKNSNAVLINKFIQLKNEDSLDHILNGTGSVPKDFELLSIDIDSCDYYIWESISEFKPKVVIIEFNPTIPVDYDYVQPPDFSIHDEHSLGSLVKLGKKKGYELICCTDTDGIFVDSKFFNLFDIKDNSPETLYKPFKYKYQTSIWQGADGTLHLVGNKQLLWHNIFINENKIQVLPKILRVFPGSTHPALQLFKRLYYNFPIIGRMMNLVLARRFESPSVTRDTSHL